MNSTLNLSPKQYAVFALSGVLALWAYCLLPPSPPPQFAHSTASSVTPQATAPEQSPVALADSTISDESAAAGSAQLLKTSQPLENAEQALSPQGKAAAPRRVMLSAEDFVDPQAAAETSENSQFMPVSQEPDYR